MGFGPSQGGGGGGDLSLYQTRAEKAAASGYASLGSDGFVPQAQALFPAIFQCRIERASATTIDLINVNKGNRYEVNGQMMTNAAPACATTDNLLAADGTSSGAAIAATTLYYVYVSNTLASYQPSNLRCSLTAPASTIGGVAYLNNTGNAANWRHVGWVYTIDAGGGTPNFADSLTQRLVVNYYNRVNLPMFVCPGYVDDNNSTNAAFVNAAFTQYHAAAQLEFISNGEDAVDLTFDLFGTGSLGSLRFGPSYDSTTTPDDIGWGNTAGLEGGRSGKPKLLTTGYHIMRGLVTCGAMNIYYDNVPNGAGVDVPLSKLSGFIKG